MTAAAAEILPGQVPDGTEWPGPDTLVLLRRALRPGTDAARLSRFSDDRWSLDPAVFEDHAKARSLNFALVPQALRLEAKHYVWQLLNHQQPRAMPRAAATRPAVSTILASFPHFKAFATWLSGRGVTSSGKSLSNCCTATSATLPMKALTWSRPTGGSPRSAGYGPTARCCRPE